MSRITDRKHNVTLASLDSNKPNKATDTESLFDFKFEEDDIEFTPKHGSCARTSHERPKIKFLGRSRLTIDSSR